MNLLLDTNVLIDYLGRKPPFFEDAERIVAAGYFGDVRSEMRKVTWPTKEEALQMTKIVIVVVLATALFLGVVDFIFSRLVGLLLG